MKRHHMTLSLLLGLTAAAQAQVRPDEGAEPGEAPLVQTTLSSQFLMLAVVDEDPENDQLMLYSVRARGQVFDGGSVFLGAGLRQAFTAEPDESGFDLRDTQLGFSWRTKVPLGTDLDLGLTHEASVFLPTSRASRAQDLYLAPQVKLGLSLEPIRGLTLATGPRFRYRFHEFAERAGTGGGMNTQLDTGIGLAADYQVFESKRFGGVTVGLSMGSDWFRKYDSREGYESEFSDQGVWLQQYSWGAHIGYGWKMFELDIALDQGGPVLRDGVVNTFLVQRDETTLGFTLAATL
jgi:hypothetical protein